MARNPIKIRVKFDKEVQGLIDDKSTALNIPSKDYNNVSIPYKLYSYNQGVNPFILGKSKLGKNQRLLSKYEGIIFKAPLPYTMRVFGVDLICLTIVFDEMNNEYPTKIKVGNVEYNNNSTRFYAFFDKTSSIDVTFDKMNNEDAPLIISQIVPYVLKDFTSDEISNFQLGKETNNANAMPSYGIVGKYGSFELLNSNGEFNSYIDNGLIDPTTRFEIYYNDTLISEMIAKEWTINSNDRKIKVSLTDYSREFDDIYVSLHDYVENISAYDVLDYLLSFTSITSIRCDVGTKYMLQGTTIKQFAITEEKNLTSLLNDFCQAFQVNMVVVNDDEIEVHFDV